VNDAGDRDLDGVQDEVRTEGTEAGGQAHPAGVRPSGEASDHDLIRAAQRGESLGFELLVKRYEDRAVRVAWGLVADREDARDLAQEAFMRVFRNIDRFDFQHEFTTWLYRIVTNLSIDHLRKRRPRQSTTYSGDEGEDVELEFSDDEADRPWEPMAREETAAQVRACIDRLAPHFQAVMVLRELEGLPCTEIAEIVGATHVTVRWRLHRGRKLFQDEWERMQRSGGLRAELEGDGTREGTEEGTNTEDDPGVSRPEGS
jgi:RNA polymerase sigma-70 factor (ECF subfamily)